MNEGLDIQINVLQLKLQSNAQLHEDLNKVFTKPYKTQHIIISQTIIMSTPQLQQPNHNQQLSYQQQLQRNVDSFLASNDSQPHQPIDSNNQNILYITLQHGIRQFKLRKQLIKFSQLLQFDTEDEARDKNDVVQIPIQIPISQPVVELIETFMRNCSYDPINVKLKNYKPYTLKEEQQTCSTNVKRFIALSLAKASKETVQQLIQLCRYLQVTTLLQVIYFHLAGKYSCSYLQKTADSQLEQFQVKKMNSQQINEMKRKYYHYFQKLTTQYKEIQKQKQLEKKYQKHTQVEEKLQDQR